MIVRNKNSLFTIFVLVNFLLYFSVLAQPKSEVNMVDDHPTLIIDGKVYPPFAYMSYLGEERYYKEVAASGVHIYNIPAYFGERGINSTSGIGPFRSPIWIGEKQYDFSSVITDFEKVLNSDSQAKAIIRLYLDPPLWWEKKNPDAASHLPDGSTFRQCFASEKWRNETGEVLKDFMEWLSKSQYADHLAGIHVAAGFTEEWFYHPQQYHDQNPVFISAFRAWLKNKYNNTAALQKAWNDSNFNFSTALPANIDEVEKRNDWRNPDKEQNYVDTYGFRAELMVENIAYFCKIVKEESHGNLLTGAFYGYHYFVTDPRRGHGALAKLLDCPDLDYLSSPNDYNRVMGEDWPPMAAVKSVHLHGKLWLAENDTRTSITTLLKDQSTGIAPPGMYEGGVWLGPEDMETSVALLWKNAARMLAYGYGGWWFDMWGGWFSDPELLTVISKTQQWDSEFQSSANIDMQPQVCVFVDEELSFWDASYGSLTNKILSNRYALAKAGTPYDLFLRTDLEAISSSQFRVIWLMGMLKLTEDEKLKIEAWRKQGITVLWTNGNKTVIYERDGREISMDGKLNWPVSDLRDIWKKAGVHLYIDTDDVLYVGNNWLSIHTVDGGERTIEFPYNAKVIDPLNNKILADATKSLRLKLNPKSTTLLRVNYLK